MSRDTTVTEVDTNGLRYKSKTNGSPFGVTGANGGTMSCYKCGHHKPRSLGVFKKLMATRMFMCAECNSPAK